MKIVRLAALMMIGTLFLPTLLLAAQLNFTPRFTLSEEYNDNIFLSNEDEEDDFITRVSFGGTLELLGRTAGAELTYLPSYAWYDDFSEFDGWSHDLFTRLWNNFSANTSLELTNAFIRTRGNLADRGFTGATTIDPLVQPDIQTDPLRTSLGEYYENSTTLRLDHQFGAEDTVFAAFNYRLRRDVDEGLDENDIWEPSIGATYWFTNFWGAESEFVYSHRDYESDEDRESWYGRLRLNRRLTRHLDSYVQYAHRYLNYQENGDDFEVYEPIAGIDYQLDQNTRIEIGAGWYFQEFDSGDSNDGLLVVALADKVWPFRRGLVGVTLLSGSDIDDEGVEDLGYNIYYEGSVRGEYAFTPSFSATASAGYRWDDYPDLDPGRTDQTIFASAGLEYQALQWMFFNLDYFFRDLSTDDDYEADEYTENRVIFSITLTPAQPFRLFR